MAMHLERAITQDFERASAIEWLETNGLGGWAGSTVAGAHGRRYHGLLVAATRPPVGRMVLLSRLDEVVHVEGENHYLGCNRFPGAVAPEGYRYLTSFRRELFPVFEYEAGGVRLRKTVAAVDGENTTLVLYEVLDAPGPILLTLRPFLASRDHHALTKADPALTPDVTLKEGVLRLRLAEGTPEVFVQVPGADLRTEPDWWLRFQYAMDCERGFDYEEDLWTPGVLAREVAPGERLGVVVSMEDPAGRDAFALFDKERKRREKLLKAVPVQDDLARELALAADRFVVRRGPGQRTVIAGYPWFGERNRDAMIALPGLCLATGRFEDARRILRSAAKVLEKGDPQAADAPLWFAVAAWKYLLATNNEDFARETLLPALRKIVRACQKGTRHGVRAAEDGLLIAPQPEAALTWMDGRVGSRPVTPRAGKAVEVEALWYNALAILAEMEGRLGDPEEGRRTAQEARRVHRRFQELFWNEEAGALFDVVDGDQRDPALRPNQVIALSLPFPLLPKARAERVLETVEARLATPVGLRSLAPDDPDYRPVFDGGPIEREIAYHQGTVWPWLLGPYLTALVRLQGNAGRRKARQILDGWRPRLAEAGDGFLPEVFDADPPHAPRGCVSRAWNVAELLRAYVEDVWKPEPAKEKTEKARTRKKAAGDAFSPA